MSTFSLYVLLKMDAIIDLFAAVWVLCLVVAPLASLLYLKIMTEDAKDDDRVANIRQKTFRFVRRLVLPGVLGLIIVVFAPSTKELAALYIVPKIVNSAQVQELPQQMLILATDWLEELRPGKTVEGVEVVGQQEHPAAAEGKPQR